MASRSRLAASNRHSLNEPPWSLSRKSVSFSERQLQSWIENAEGIDFLLKKKVVALLWVP
jgi:hypothetical protein